jgi:hypothetical protein
MGLHGPPERLARFANGLLVLAFSLLILSPDTLLSKTGFWLTLFMGGSLIFSGITGFCGWYRIFQWTESSVVTNRSSRNGSN